MGFFNKSTDTEKEINEYYKNRNNQSINRNNNYDNAYNNYNDNNYGMNNNNNYNSDYRVNNNYNNRLYNADNINNMNNAYYQNQENPNRVYIKPPRKSKAILLMFLIIFFLIAVLNVVSSTTNNYAVSLIMARIAPYLFLSVFVFVGLSVAFGPIITGVIKKRRCKVQLKAIVVDMHCYRSSKGKRSYAPVYQYLYCGKEYIARASSHRNYALPAIGDEVDILINEMNPEDFYVDEKKANIFTLIFGLIFAILPLFMLFSESFQ